MSSFKGLVAVTVAAQANASNSTFVPVCIDEHCSAEFLALSEDKYTSSLANCAMSNFGPCASKAWDCLGDDTCRKAATCAPKVFDTCKADIWKVITDDKEREMIMCIDRCPVGKDGRRSNLCALEKCGQAAVDCLVDDTCRHAVNCVPKAMLSCSASAFKCVFGSVGVCRENVKCLGNGLAQCSAPGVNILTDTKIADLITCAGSKCPHPISGIASVTDKSIVQDQLSLPAPIDAASQLLCMEAHCPLKLPKILLDQDSKDLLTCAGKTNLSAVWECLGDATCQNALSCWSKPLQACERDIWYVLTDDVERQRIENGAKCLGTCHEKYLDDFMAATFCMLDECNQDVLDCYKDDKCRSALKCLPATASECSIPTLAAYASQPLFQQASKAVASGLESCGRAAVEIVRDQNIADGIRCAAKCTRPPKGMSEAMLVV